MLDRSELEQMLETMARSGASTLHLMTGRVPCLRLQGKLVRSQAGIASATDLQALIDDMLTTEQRGRLAAGEEIDSLFTSRSGTRLRSTVCRDSEGVNLVFRCMPQGAPKFADLGLPECIGALTSFHSGLLLVTGFLGSGKSMTLAAIVDHINRTAARHIVTIEQPVEVVHEPSASLIHQRDVGRQVSSFAQGIRDAVRQGADVIMVGDVRDYETLDAALDAAERGCLVLGAFQASSVVGALEDIVALGPEAAATRLVQRLASVVRVVIAQTQLRRAHDQGRVPLLEILVNNQAVARAIVARNFPELANIMDRSRGLGMQTNDQGLKDLLGRNVITVDEALYHATDRESIYQRSRG